MDNDDEAGRQEPLLEPANQNGNSHETDGTDGGGRHPWELVAASSSSELEEAEEYEEATAAAAEGGGGGGEGAPFLPTARRRSTTTAVLPLHQPLLPWALVKTPAARLREEDSALSDTSESAASRRRRPRGWGRRLAKLAFWPPPIVRWLPRYTRQQALGDVLGGLTVAVMVIPQGMSYAVLAGLPPVYGLFAAMTAPLVYTLLGSSRHLSIGPVALVSLGLPRVCEVLYPSLDDLPEEQATALRVEAATAVALVSGLLLLALGCLRLGVAAHFLPPAVMVGFTSAAALAIGVSQLKELLGLHGVPRYPYTWQTCAYVLSHIQDGQLASALIGFGCILFLLGLKHAKAAWVDPSPHSGLKRAFRLFQPLSNLLLVVATALIASLLVRRGVDIAVVKDVPNGLPTPAAPKLGGRFGAIAGHSLSVVLVAFMEAYAIGRKYALAEGYPLHVNKELVALGASNAVASFFASYPVSGSFSRTAVSHASGTQTPLANAVAALLVMAAVRLFAPYFYYIPRATLGAIIEVALLNLLDVPALRRECARSRLDALVLLATFAVTLALDTELGLLAGLVAAALTLYWTPRGGALLTRLALRPALKRRPRCDVLVLDLARLARKPAWVRRRLADFLRHERAARGAGPHLLVLLDGDRLGETGGSSSSSSSSLSSSSWERVRAAIEEATAAAAEVGIPREMVVPVGLPLALLASEPTKGDHAAAAEEEKQRTATTTTTTTTGASKVLPPLVQLTPEQEEVARGVLARAHSLGLVCDFGAEVAARFQQQEQQQSGPGPGQQQAPAYGSGAADGH